jgi:hypothetical protein
MALGVPDLMTIASFSDALQHHLFNSLAHNNLTP